MVIGYTSGYWQWEWCVGVTPVTCCKKKKAVSERFYFSRSAWRSVNATGWKIRAHPGVKKHIGNTRNFGFCVHRVDTNPFTYRTAKIVHLSYGFCPGGSSD
jgi:hypothetical protein